MWDLLEALELLLNLDLLIKVLPWAVGLILGVLAVSSFDWAKWAFAAWVAGIVLFYWLRARRQPQRTE